MLNYTSILKSELSEELEQLMFFNPGQHTFHDGILASIDQFGSPSVYEDNGCLRVKVEKLDEVQTLYALDDGIPVGVLVYSRVTPEHLTVIYIAVDHNYSPGGQHADQLLVMRMLKILRKSARRIKGVETIRIIRSSHRIQDYPVRRRTCAIKTTT